mmetsp:Transcript_10439/g.34624  ORF Transcript_10439/g.34624 Transcript_10439/m.34624 type:complete len:229 (+) Transcript_10439:1472-2158(+)
MGRSRTSVFRHSAPSRYRSRPSSPPTRPRLQRTGRSRTSANGWATRPTARSRWCPSCPSPPAWTAFWRLRRSSRSAAARTPPRRRGSPPSPKCLWCTCGVTTLTPTGRPRSSRWRCPCPRRSTSRPTAPRACGRASRPCPTSPSLPPPARPRPRPTRASSGSSSRWASLRTGPGAPQWPCPTRPPRRRQSGSSPTWGTATSTTRSRRPARHWPPKPHRRPPTPRPSPC